MGPEADSNEFVPARVNPNRSRVSRGYQRVYGVGSHQEADQEANGKKVRLGWMSDALLVNQKIFYCISCLQIG